MENLSPPESPLATNPNKNLMDEGKLGGERLEDTGWMTISVEDQDENGMTEPNLTLDAGEEGMTIYGTSVDASQGDGGSGGGNDALMQENKEPRGQSNGDEFIVRIFTHGYTVG